MQISAPLIGIILILENMFGKKVEGGPGGYTIEFGILV